MSVFSFLDLTNHIEGQITIDGIPYKFYNTGLHYGTYKKYPISDGGRSVDGNWEVIQSEIGYEFVTRPALSKERLFLNVSLTPESLLASTINLVKPIAL